MKAEPTKAQIAWLEKLDTKGPWTTLGNSRVAGNCRGRGWTAEAIFSLDRITPLGRQVLAEAREKESRDA